jgi:hypothetical protein
MVGEISTPSASGSRTFRPCGGAHRGPGPGSTVRCSKRSPGTRRSKIMPLAPTPYMVCRLRRNCYTVWGPSGSTPFLWRLGAVLLVALFVGCGQSEQGSRDQPADSPDREIARSLKRNFSLFQGSTEIPAPSLISHLQSVLRRPGGFRPDPSLTQRASTAVGVAWVFANDGDVCLAQGHHGSAACAPVRQVRAEGLSLGVFSPPSKAVQRPHNFVSLGLVPDSVHEVDISIGKRRKRIAVQNNLYSASGDRPVFVRRFLRSKR